MKFRYNYFNALSAFVLISFFLLMFLICAIYICPKCYNDFKKYYRFKIKD